MKSWIIILSGIVGCWHFSDLRSESALQSFFLPCLLIIFVIALAIKIAILLGPGNGSGGSGGSPGGFSGGGDCGDGGCGGDGGC